MAADPGHITRSSQSSRIRVRTHSHTWMDVHGCSRYRGLCSAPQGAPSENHVCGGLEGAERGDAHLGGCGAMMGWARGWQL